MEESRIQPSSSANPRDVLTRLGDCRVCDHESASICMSMQDVRYAPAEYRPDENVGVKDKHLMLASFSSSLLEVFDDLVFRNPRTFHHGVEFVGGSQERCPILVHRFPPRR